MNEQLFLFEQTREERLENDLKILKQKYDTLRKSAHAKISAINKMATDTKYELDILKAAICRGETLLEYRQIKTDTLFAKEA